jgi:hypothetical protein
MAPAPSPTAAGHPSTGPVGFRRGASAARGLRAGGSTELLRSFLVKVALA